MDVGIKGLVEAIHATPTQAVLYFSGGASQVPSLSPLSIHIDAFVYVELAQEWTTGKNDFNMIYYVLNWLHIKIS